MNASRAELSPVAGGAGEFEQFVADARQIAAWQDADAADQHALPAICDHAATLRS